MSKINRTITYPIVETLIDDVINDIERGFCTNVFCTEDIADDVIKGLLCGVDGIKIAMLDYDTIDYGNREYEIAVNVFGDEIELFVSPCWHESNEWHNAGYYMSECDVAYVDDNCDDELLDNIYANITVFDIEE